MLKPEYQPELNRFIPEELLGNWWRFVFFCFDSSSL